jgi:hypothetical protein
MGTGRISDKIYEAYKDNCCRPCCIGIITEGRRRTFQMGIEQVKKARTGFKPVLAFHKKYVDQDYCFIILVMLL